MYRRRICADTTQTPNRKLCELPDRVVDYSAVVFTLGRPSRDGQADQRRDSIKLLLRETTARSWPVAPPGGALSSTGCAWSHHRQQCADGIVEGNLTRQGRHRRAGITLRESIDKSSKEQRGSSSSTATIGQVSAVSCGPLYLYSACVKCTTAQILKNTSSS